MKDEQNMSASELLDHLARIEVTPGYARDFRALVRDEREILSVRMSSGDRAGIAAQVAEIRRVLAMWPEATRRA